MPVPFVDLKAQYRSIRDEIQAAIGEVLDQTAFVLGPAVDRFERDFAAYLGTEQSVGVGTGTAALHLTLLALGIGPGDEVIVPAHTFIATAEAVSHAGARPVFVDVQESSGNLDPDLLEEAISPRTKAVIAVHLYGQPADMDEIAEITARHGIHLVEDACQAHGAKYRGRRAGSLGVAGCFSFYPGKNLGAYGEGGAVATSDSALGKKIRSLRDHGQAARYHHDVVGYNSRLEGIQGAVLGVKLRYLDRWNEARREHARYYGKRLGAFGVALPYEAPDRESVYHLYVVRTSARDALQAHLGTRGVQSGLHYPRPLHLQAAYSDLGYKPGVFPVAERWATTCLSLPMYPELTPALMDEVAEGVSSFAMEGVAGR